MRILSLLSYLGMPFIVNGVVRWLRKRRGLSSDSDSWQGASFAQRRQGESADFTAAESPFCIHCGAAKESGAKICKSCGKKY